VGDAWKANRLQLQVSLRSRAAFNAAKKATEMTVTKKAKFKTEHVGYGHTKSKTVTPEVMELALDRPSKKGTKGILTAYLSSEFETDRGMGVLRVEMIFRPFREQEYSKTTYKPKPVNKPSNPGNPTMKPKLDEVAVRELELYVDNTRSLYDQKVKIFWKSMAAKVARKRYDHEKAVYGFLHLADRAAKQYAKEFGGTWHTMFPKPERMEVARTLRDEFEDMVQTEPEELAPLLPKKYSVADLHFSNPKKARPKKRRVRKKKVTLSVETTTPAANPKRKRRRKTATKKKVAKKRTVRKKVAKKKVRKRAAPTKKTARKKTARKRSSRGKSVITYMEYRRAKYSVKSAPRTAFPKSVATRTMKSETLKMGEKRTGKGTGKKYAVWVSKKTGKVTGVQKLNRK
jgi:hypothetical protein